MTTEALSPQPQDNPIGRGFDVFRRRVLGAATRYGKTKQGRDQLIVSYDEIGTIVRVSNGHRTKRQTTTWRELTRLKVDDATARVCDVIDRLLFELRAAEAKVT